VSAKRANAAGSRRRLLGAGTFAGALVALALMLGLPRDGGVAAASGAPSSTGCGEEDCYQTDSALPALEVMIFGASPREAPAETWGIGKARTGTDTYVVVHYIAGSGWTQAPAILDSGGAPLSGFVPAKGVLAGQMAPDGAGTLAGFVGRSQVLLVRNPGQPFQETSVEPVPEEGEEALLHPGEALFSGTGAPLVAALEEGASAGALVVPARSEGTNTVPGVLHWEGQVQRWKRESIELPAGDSASDFTPIAVGASSPENAWLLAEVNGSEAVSLFRRDPGSAGTPASWKPVSPGAGQEPGSPLEVDGAPVTLETGATAGGQRLTVTSQGVWVDGERNETKLLTLFFEPSAGERYSGKIAASWCNEEGCSHPLPEELPLGPYRSFAWAGTGKFGERVITGFPDGVILRLEGEEFTRVATVGGPPAPEDVGGTLGAAFSSAFEGWLGNDSLPVHVTQNKEPEERLDYWPAPFHEPLLAIAAQPGAPVGALSSEALAVGDGGEVARYMPGQGWQPETLFETGGHGEPQLRALAWPTVNRAYAVGVTADGSGAMWLWRGETKLWEPDPAAPVNLRANLLGIAFAPGEPTRGYAVGQGGTLLRYGKTWTQEPTCENAVPQPCLPPEVAGASFTAIAFAGAEALVAYRAPHLVEGALGYTGGVLTNDGSGWHVNTEIATALGPSTLPWTVAGLPDGGAAVSAANAFGEGPILLERNSAGSLWQPTPEPYPGDPPSSLALFREGGALRIVGTGAVPDTVETDNVNPAPVGSPPTLIAPYPLGLAAGLTRQSATGWIDEEPERRVLSAPPGHYEEWDVPYSPDPTAAILLGENGSSGWAVGGQSAHRPGADTADIARYPTDGSSPPNAGPAAIELEKAEQEGREKEGETIPLEGQDDATFALAGGAGCAAPCADLLHSRLGPDVWLKDALAEADGIHGVRDFLYTGPRLTNGATIGRATIPVPYEREFGRYAAVLKEGRGSLPVAIAASSTDYVPPTLQGSLCQFEHETMAPLFGGESLADLEPPPAGECAAGQSAYYAFTSQGTPAVRVIVLDDNHEVGQAQLKWLQGELQGASESNTPAIVLGSANLDGPVDKEGWAHNVKNALVEDGASAYLFDSPEENVELTIESEAPKHTPVPAFGSGTLGYVEAISSEESDFIGASGFLLVVVEKGSHAAKVNEPETNRVPVIARLIPAIGELSLDAEGGTLLRRSQVAAFSALARRPRAGGRAPAGSSENQSDTFIPIPSNCQGGECAEGIFPEYTFSSSDAKIGAFVKPNLSLGPEAVELKNEEPIPDPKSGLFCAYNAGETTVTIDAGGLKAALKVTVQPGSVRRPCGTTPLNETPAKAHERAVATPLQPSPVTASASPTPAPLPLPPPPATPVTPPAARVPPAATAAFFAPQALPAFVPPFVPPPVPTPARPTPPSGTSAVEAVEREEEQEEAPESASVQASAYYQAEQEPAPAYLLGLIVLAALGGATIRPRLRRRRREVRVAPATITAIRSQRRMGRDPRPPW
jgi:hypothetical protein